MVPRSAIAYLASHGEENPLVSLEAVTVPENALFKRLQKCLFLKSEISGTFHTYGMRGFFSFSHFFFF